MWDWGFGNNHESLTKEMSAYVLDDGTLLTIPWHSSTDRTCNFPIGGDSFDDYTGAYSYQVREVNGRLSVVRSNNMVGGNTVFEIRGYVHTHPYTATNPYGLDVYTPTDKIDDPSNPNNVGDYELSKKYGIPGYIITEDKIVMYEYSADCPDSKRVTRYTNKNFCNPTPEP